MVTVAIAGATGTTGKNLVNEILASKKHKLIVLARSVQPALVERGAIVRLIDYEDKQKLAQALEGVDTLISCIWLFGDYVTPQLALLDAAKVAKVRRFVPSDWANPLYDRISAYKGKGVVWQAVEASGLEHTRFINGIFMNLWGLGASKNKAEALGGYDGPSFVVEFNTAKATIPGDGSDLLVFSRLQDIARFTVAALDLDKWEKDSVIVGDKLSYNDVILLAEEQMGKKFHVTYVSLERIEKTLANPPDPFSQFFAEFNHGIVKGELNVKETLNTKFPEIKPWTVEQYIASYW